MCFQLLCRTNGCGKTEGRCTTQGTAEEIEHVVYDVPEEMMLATLIAKKRILISSFFKIFKVLKLDAMATILAFISPLQSVVKAGKDPTYVRL